jgi:hypothetical protein
VQWSSEELTEALDHLERTGRIKRDRAEQLLTPPCPYLTIKIVDFVWRRQLGGKECTHLWFAPLADLLMDLGKSLGVDASKERFEFAAL